MIFTHCILDWLVRYSMAEICVRWSDNWTTQRPYSPILCTMFAWKYIMRMATDFIKKGWSISEQFIRCTCTKFHDISTVVTKNIQRIMDILVRWWARPKWTACTWADETNHWNRWRLIWKRNQLRMSIFVIQSTTQFNRTVIWTANFIIHCEECVR